MMSLSDDTQADIIDVFNTTFRYLDDILQSRLDCQKTVLIFLFSPQLILQFYFKEKYNFPRFRRGSCIFKGEGSNFFHWDLNANLYRNP